MSAQILSQSSLWSCMQSYYQEAGPSAWQEEIVPSQISSNSALAFNYACVILGQILDWNNTNNLTLSANNPFYIIELGSGHGKFAFYCLKHLEHLMAMVELPIDCVKLILTDISSKNCASWQQHHAFMPWVKRGIVDFAIFNAEQDNVIELLASKQAINAKSLKTPILAIANYLLDSLTHDGFQICDKRLHETRIEVCQQGEFFENTQFKFTHLPCKLDYYADKNLNNILSYYSKHYTNASFLLPVGGIKCFNNLASFTTAFTSLLVADKGTNDKLHLEGLSDPDITMHGSVSLMVNFDALRLYFAELQGSAFMMPNTASEFQVALFSNADCALQQSRLAYYQNFSAACPQDLVNLCYPEDNISPNITSIDEILALLHLSHWDPNIFYDFHEIINEQIEQHGLTLEQEQSLIHGATKVWDYFFKLEINQDLPFALGALYYALNDYEKSINFYKLSASHFGENAENLYNIALCYQLLEENQELRTTLTKLQQCYPEFTPGQQLLQEATC